MLPWPKLNELMDIVETLNAEARRVYETKKKLLESGDDETVKQVGEGKDILSILSTYDSSSFSDEGFDVEIPSASSGVRIQRHSTERRGTTCTNGVCPHVLDLVVLDKNISYRVLVSAAAETTSSALSRILHLLALHPDIQDRVRQELKEASGDNEELTHDQLVSLPFLDAVCRETLRMWVDSLASVSPGPC